MGEDSGGSTLTLLPELGVVLGDEQPPVAPRSARLLAHLAVERGRHARGAVATALWPAAHPDRAYANLRAAVFALPTSLRGLVVLSGADIELAGHVDVDLHSATRAARELLGDDDAIPDEDLRVRLTRDVLPGWSEEWLTGHQVRWAQLRAQALEVSVERFSRRGCHGLAVDVALAARESDPLRESAHLALVRAHVAQGNRYQAIEAYRCYARMLDVELGIGPQVPLAALLSPAPGTNEPALAGTGADHMF